MMVLGVLVVPFLPWFMAWGLLSDARRYLRLASWPAPLSERGVDELLARLQREAPKRVERIEAEWSTGFAAEEARWSLVAVCFVDRSVHVVSALPWYERPNAVARVVSAARAHGLAVRERTINEHRDGMGAMLAYAASIVWAVALALLVAPSASLIALAPLPISRLVCSRARRAAERTILEAAR